MSVDLGIYAKRSFSYFFFLFLGNVSELDFGLGCDPLVIPELI